MTFAVLAAMTALAMRAPSGEAQNSSAIPVGLGSVITPTDTLTHTTFLPLVARNYPDPLTRLENNGYEDLAAQLRALPEITDGITVTDTEALEDIATLALTATDPEVREALGLMVNGGIGSDLVVYGPSWNTQLQALFWLAQQNEFRPNDNLAQAIAMVNGLWVAMGDNEVDQAVFSEVNTFLEFQRTYNPHVEQYPLEALVTLSWMGNYSVSGGRVFPLRNYKDQPISLQVYEWNTVEVDTLLQMRGRAVGRGWIGENSGETIGNIENYFYFDGHSEHWEYASDSVNHQIIEVDGIMVANHDLNNVHFIWGHYLETDKGIGECGDNAILTEAIAKSLGIPVTEVIRQATDTEKVVDSHMFPLYRGDDGSWTAYDKELDIGQGLPYDYTLYVARPPINHADCLNYWREEPYYIRWFGNMYYIPDRTFRIDEIRTLISNGITSQEMKEWLIDSQFSTTSS